MEQTDVSRRNEANEVQLSKARNTKLNFPKLVEQRSRLAEFIEKFVVKRNAKISQQETRKMSLQHQNAVDKDIENNLKKDILRNWMKSKKLFSVSLIIVSPR